MKILQPPGWPAPRGYANGVMASGRQVFVSGQIGWNEQEKFSSENFIEQTRQALLNIISVLKEGDAGPEHIVRMTWYITDKSAYLASAREIGRVYREIIGRHYPAMSMVEVVALMEDEAKVEIEATAVVPDD